MARPQSVVRFTWLYLASVIVALVTFALAWGQMMDQFAANPQFAGNPQVLNMIPAMMIGFLVIYYGITLLFWWLVGFKGVNAMRWIFAILNGLGLVFFLYGLANGAQQQSTISMIGSILAWGLAIVAFYFVFQRDANAWFTGSVDADTAADPFA